jgi:hypothetical protein
MTRMSPGPPLLLLLSSRIGVTIGMYHWHYYYHDDDDDQMMITSVIYMYTEITRAETAAESAVTQTITTLAITNNPINMYLIMTMHKEVWYGMK